MRRSSFIVIAAAIAALCAVIPAGAITNGQPDGNGHPNVGVMVVDFGNGPERLCSGELIAATQFLTAAHCTARFVGNTNIRLIGVTFDPAYDPATSTVDPATAVTVADDGTDLGVITLAQPVAAPPITLPALGLLDRLSAQGGLHNADFTLVGYGATGFDYGGGQPTPADLANAVRRITTSPFKALEQTVLKLQGNTNATDEGGICFGDSGSPAYLDVDGTRVVVGTASTSDARCVGNDGYYRLDTPSARAFLGRFVSLP